MPMPPRQLKGFSKIVLAPGEERRVSWRLDRPALSFWSIEHAAWQPVPGALKVEIGASSRDIRLEGRIPG